MIDLAIARFVELLRETCPDRGRPRRRRGRTERVATRAPRGPRAHRAGEPAARHRPRRPTISASCSTRSATPSPATGDVRDRGAPVMAVRLHHRDRRDRGGRPPLRLRAASARRFRSRPSTAVSRVRQQRRRLAREVLLGLGISEAMPNPFLAPDTLERRRAARRVAVGDQPAGGRRVRAAHLAATWSARRRSPTTSRIAAPV